MGDEAIDPSWAALEGDASEDGASSSAGWGAVMEAADLEQQVADPWDGVVSDASNASEAGSGGWGALLADAEGSQEIDEEAGDAALVARGPLEPEQALVQSPSNRSPATILAEAVASLGGSEQEHFFALGRICSEIGALPDDSQVNDQRLFGGRSLEIAEQLARSPHLRSAESIATVARWVPLCFEL